MKSNEDKWLEDGFETATAMSTIENTIAKYCQGHVLLSKQNDQFWN